MNARAQTAFLRQTSLGFRASGLCLNTRKTLAAAPLEGGRVAFFSPDDSGEKPLLLQPHSDAAAPLLCADADDHAFLSGGKDGSLLILESGVAVPTPLVEKTGAPLTALAAAPQGLRAFARGKDLSLLDINGASFGELVSAPEHILALSFSPDGAWLVARGETFLILRDLARAQGLVSTLPLTNPVRALLWRQSQPASFWAGGPQGLSLWQIEEGGEGFKELEHRDQPVDSLSFSAQESFLLAASGPRLLATSQRDGRSLFLGDPSTRATISALADHPFDPLIAIGYTDGSLILAPLDGRREILLLPPLGEKEEAALVGLAWNKDGDALTAILVSGDLFLFTYASIMRFIKTFF